MFSCHLQRMPSGTMVIFIEFPVMHWHFGPVLNAFVMVARATIRVYMFHSRHFCALVMSPLFCPYALFDDVTLDDIRPPFHLLRYPTDGKSDSDTDIFCRIQSFGVILLGVFYEAWSFRAILSFDDSFVFGFFLLFFVYHVPPPIHGHGRARGGGCEMMHLVASGTDIFCSTGGLDSKCQTGCKDSLFCW